MKNELKTEKFLESNSIAIRKICGLILSLTATTSIMAADITPVNGLDTSARGKVYSADTLPEGASSIRLQIHSTTQPLNQSAILKKPSPNSDDAVSNRVSQAAVLFGIGISKRLEIGIGVHASNDGNISNKQGVFSEKNNEDESNQSNLKPTAFSGASIMAKIKLIDASALKLSVAPFVRSGAGQEASYSLSRSENSTGGWMGLFSYGAEGVGTLNLNAGYRYRDQERLGRLILGNEVFYQASIDAYLNRTNFIFVGGQGRKIRVADDDKQIDGQERRTFHHWATSEFFAGLGSSLGQYDVKLYGGSRYKRSRLFGSGNSIIGLSFGYNFGNEMPKGAMNYPDKEQRSSKAIADEEDENVKGWNPKTGKKKNKKFKNESDLDLESGSMFSDIDKTAAGKHKASAKGDDFDVLLKKLQDENANREKTSQEQSDIDLELEKLREADLIAKEKALRLEKKEAEIRRAQQAEEFDENNKLIEQYKKELKPETDKLPSIGSDEENWDGLYE